MKIYTRTGDQGETGLPGPVRVPKDAARLEVCGTIDELNSVLGMARAAGLPQAIDRLVERIQHQLLAVGAELAAGGPSGGFQPIGPEQVGAFEQAIDEHTAALPALRSFVVTGGTPAAATLHVARTVCRRAERRLVSLVRSEPGASRAHLLVYLNRLSDLLFVLARSANTQADVGDMLWDKNPT